MSYFVDNGTYSTLQAEIGMFLCLSLLFKHQIQLIGVYMPQH